MPNTDPIFGLTPNLAEVTFTNADTTTLKDLISGGASGTKITGISVCSDDTAAVNMRLFVHDGTTAFLVGTINVPTLSGTNGVAPAIDMLNGAMLPWLDQDGEFYIPTGYKLQVGCLATMTAAKTATVVCFGINY